MRTALICASAALVGVVASAAPVAAQPRPAVVNRPTFSPYLNLLSGYGSPALNYYGLVRPQIQFQQQAAQFQQQINQTNQAIQAANNPYQYGLIDPSIPLTGRGATFGYYSHYYPTLGGGGGGLVGAGGGARVGGFGGGPSVPAFAQNRVGQTGQAPQRPAGGRAGGAGGARR